MAPEYGTVGAVIVTYRPQSTFLDRLHSRCALAQWTIIVDNGSPAETVDRLRSLATTLGFDLIANGANLGVATALNQGLRRAQERGAAWGLLLDQDSEPNPAIVERMAAAIADYGKLDRVAIVGANYAAPGEERGRYPDGEPADRSFSVQMTVITSGSLVSIAAFGQIGPFSDGMFIDHVDHEYCLRARKLGFAVLATREVLLVHSIGRESVHPFLGRRVFTSNHPPARRYYMARNAIVVTRRHLAAEPRWVASMLRQMLRDAVAMLLFESDRGPKFRWWLRGVWDGLRGKLGPIADASVFERRHAE